jgi:hypothetical protein
MQDADYNESADSNEVVGNKVSLQNQQCLMDMGENKVNTLKQNGTDPEAKLQNQPGDDKRDGLLLLRMALSTKVFFSSLMEVENNNNRDFMDEKENQDRNNQAGDSINSRDANINQSGAKGQILVNGTKTDQTGGTIEKEAGENLKNDES